MGDKNVQLKLREAKPLKIGDKVFKSAYDWELTDKELKKAACELGETEEIKKQCLRKLKEKLSSDTKVTYYQDDEYLLRYLRFRKFDVKKAYQNIKLFYDVRKKHPEVFEIPWDVTMSVQKLNFYSMLPYTDEEDRIILLMNFDRWNLDEVTLEEILHSAMNVYDIVTLNPKCQINGIVGIWDAAGVSVKHVSKVLWDSRIRKILTILQNGFPRRITRVYILNTNRFVRYMYNMLKHLVQKKIADRCVLLGSDMNELHQYVNPALLPKKLNGSLEDEEWDMSQLIQDNMHYLNYERSFVFK